VNIVMWVIAGLLALTFLGSGLSKILLPRERLSAYGLKWVEAFSPTSLKLIGGLEMLAAVGLVLPAVLDIAPILVPVAALGLVALMAGAFVLHVRRREAQGIVMALLLLALAAFVAWGRFGGSPFGT
jgi:DoxX-like family